MINYSVISTHLSRCLRGDWAGMDDASVYNCSVAVAEARAAKYVTSYDAAHNHMTFL